MERSAEGERPSGGAFQRKLTEGEARRLLEEHERTGQTLAAFAKQQGLTASRLGWWRTKLKRKESNPPPRRRAAFLPLVVRSLASEAQAGERCFEVALRGGRLIRVPASFDAQGLRRLVMALEEVPLC